MKKRTVFAVVPAVLLAASADAQTTDFCHIVKTGTPQQIQDAVNQGADVNAQDFGYALLRLAGATALMCAASRNPDPDMITTLLKAGADTKAKDRTGRTAIDYAQGNEKLKDTDACWKLNNMQH